MKPLLPAIVLCEGGAVAASAQSDPLSIQFTPAAVKGALYSSRIFDYVQRWINARF